MQPETPPCVWCILLFLHLIILYVLVHSVKLRGKKNSSTHTHTHSTKKKKKNGTWHVFSIPWVPRFASGIPRDANVLSVYFFWWRKDRPCDINGCRPPFVLVAQCPKYASLLILIQTIKKKKKNPALPVPGHACPPSPAPPQLPSIIKEKSRKKSKSWGAPCLALLSVVHDFISHTERIRKGEGRKRRKNRRKKKRARKRKRAEFDILQFFPFLLK